MTDRVYLAVFDCDGTLVDSQHSIVSCMQTAFANSGLDTINADEVRHMVGLTLLEGIARLLPGESSERHQEVAEHYRVAFQQSRMLQDYEEPLYDGVKECLQALETDNVVMGVATGKGRRGLEMTLRRHNIHDRFAVLKTADDGPGKPHPAILLDAMAETGACPETTIMIGDTVFDMELAVNARVKAVGVSWGYHSPTDLKQCGADVIVQNCADIHGALKKLWRLN